MFLPGHLRESFHRLNVNCVIDVGANVGRYSSMLRKGGYNGRIISIEPLAEAHARLKERAQIDDSWRTLNIALGESDETKVLNIFAASDLSSLLVQSVDMEKNIPGSDITGTQSIVVKRLDTIMDQLIDGLDEPRVFLKMDTQGYDLKVVRGGNKFLRHVYGIQSELSVIPIYEDMPDYIESLTFYRSLGFEPTGIFPVTHELTTQHVIEFDAILTRCGGQ